MSFFDIVLAKQLPKIRHIPSGELMHSVGHSEAEVDAIYIKQSRLSEKLALSLEEPLVLWDVGLGASLNASAAIAEARKGKNRALRLVSFEIDLTPARLVCENPQLFPSIDTDLLSELLKSKRITTEFLDWVLIEGDFEKTYIDAISFGYPEVCFFDPFSPKTDQSMWTFELFCRLNQMVADRDFELFTYSQSTAIRAGFLAAGFFVATGIALPPKESSTVVCTSKIWEQQRFHFLDERWRERWHRSSSQYPLGVSRKDQFFQAIETHSQFLKR